MDQRGRVLAEARRWIGTRYVHEGNVLGHGVDCGMLLVEVYAAAGTINWFDPRPYSPQFHFHRDEQFYLGHLERLAREVKTPQPGDAAIWTVGRVFSHGGVVTGWDGKYATVVHALQSEGVCLEEKIERGRLLRKPVKYFNFWGDA